MQVEIEQPLQLVMGSPRKGIEQLDGHIQLAGENRIGRHAFRTSGRRDDKTQIHTTGDCGYARCRGFDSLVHLIGDGTKKRL